MKKKCWAIKLKNGKGFVNRMPEHYWEAERVLLFKSQKQAESWLMSNQFWTPKAEVKQVTVTVKECSDE
jgi:hypothetical protein